MLYGHLKPVLETDNHINMSSRRVTPGLLARAALRGRNRGAGTSLRLAPAPISTRTLHHTSIRRDQQSKNDVPRDLTPKEQPEEGANQLQSTDLLDVYNSLVARGLIVWDAEQVRCVMEVSRRSNREFESSEADQPTHWIYYS
jgi:hypothetical protein